MLTHPTLDKLQALKFTGMAEALAEQMNMPDIDTLSFEERLGLLIDREVTARENRRLSSRLRPGPKGLPRGALGPLPAPAPAPPGHGHRQGRRTLSQAPGHPR